MNNRLPQVFFLLFLLFLLNATLVEAQTVRGGKADLSNVDFSTQGPILLNGNWKFYWNELLTPEDFASARKGEEIVIPSSWTYQNDRPVLGYATYRVTIVLPDERGGLSIFLPIVNSAAKVWVNGKFVAELGKVGTSSAEHMGKLSSTLVPIPEESKTADIVIQVSNFSYFGAGFPRTPQIDKTASIVKRTNRAKGIENFFAGSLMAMFIYQFIMYFLYQRGKPFLWLGLICLLVALRAMIVHGGSFLLPDIFPDVSWELWKKIEFGGVYAMGAFFPLYIYDLFKANNAPAKPVVLFVAISGLLCAITVFTPQYVYGKLLDISHMTLLLGFVYAVYTILGAWRAKNSDAKIILFGVLASFPFILAEIIKNSFLLSLNIHFTNLVELGVLVFLLFQVYLLAHHYSKSYSNLESVNVELEKRVSERTGELETANTVKDRLLSVMSHDIKSPLNSLRGILQIFNKGQITKDEFAHFATKIESDLNRTTLLVENILYWTSSQLKGITVRFDSFNLKTMIEENFHLFETMAQTKRIALSHQCPEDLMILSDRNILNLVLRNLIANALKFSYEDSAITVYATNENGVVIIQVIDQGMGMDEKTIETLLQPALLVSTFGTKNEKGTGLGLSLCHEYLKEIHGALTVQSSKGNGSTFTISINQKLPETA